MANRNAYEVLIEKLFNSARAIISNQIGIPLGCRKMQGLILRLNTYENGKIGSEFNRIYQEYLDKWGAAKIDYIIFAQYFHETTSLPISSERLEWDREALREEDKKLSRINEKFYNGIIDVCFDIIQKFGNNSK